MEKKNIHLIIYQNITKLKKIKKIKKNQNPITFQRKEKNQSILKIKVFIKKIYLKKCFKL